MAENGQSTPVEAEGSAPPEQAPENGAPESQPADASTQPEVTDEQLQTEMRALLETADLATTSEKQLRKKLEEKLGIDLGHKKAVLRACVEAFLAEQESSGDEENGEEEEEEEAPAEKPKKKRASQSSKLGSILSPELQAFLGEESLPRPQVVKRIWDYIKENNLQNPKDKRKIILDDKLKTIFKPPITMFSMNKQLSKHCKTDSAKGGKRSRKASSDDDGDDPSDSDSSEAEASGDDYKPPKTKKTRKSSGGGGGGGFAAPANISAELREFLGTDEPVSRGQISKLMWAYFKSNNLQNPENKQIIICDDKLKKLLGVEEFKGFGMAKLLAPHFLKKGENGPAADE